MRPVASGAAVVAVHELHVCSDRMFQGQVTRGSHAAVVLRKHAHPSVPRGNLPQKRQALIGTAVIHSQHFNIFKGLVQHAPEAAHKRFFAAL